MKAIYALFALLLPASVFAGTMTVTYTRPTQFTDGSPVPSSLALTYVVYAAIEGDPLVEVQRSSELRQSLTVSAGRWCAQVFAVNVNVYSDPSPSPMWCGTVPALPTEPQPTSRKTRPPGDVVITVTP